MGCDPFDCLPDTLHHSPATDVTAAPPRCFLLGPSGSGKTTFLHRIKSGNPATIPADDPDKQAAIISYVEEIPVVGKHTIILTDPGPDRRDFRLHFLSTPTQPVSILYFIDANCTLPQLANALEMLVYAVTYAQGRGGVSYVGIVLNRQDLLPDEDVGIERGVFVGGRRQRVEQVKREVEEVMEMVCSFGMAGEKAMRMLRWEVLSGYDSGISGKMGWGVAEVFDRVCMETLGVERGRKGVVTGEPVFTGKKCA